MYRRVVAGYHSTGTGYSHFAFLPVKVALGLCVVVNRLHQHPRLGFFTECPLFIVAVYIGMVRKLCLI